MKGFIGILAVAYLFRHADAQVTGWDRTSLTGATPASGVDVAATLTAKVLENKIPGSTLFSVLATKTGGGAFIYAITSGDTDTVMTIDAAGDVKLAASKSLDFEKTPSYTLKITAVETGQTGTTGTLTLTVSIKNVLEFGQTQYGACVSDGATGDTSVGTYAVSDNTASTTVTYAIASGDANSEFAISTAGVLKVATGKTLAQKTTGGYSLGLSATETGGASDVGSTTVWIAVGTCGSSAVHVAATLGFTLLALVASVFA